MKPIELRIVRKSLLIGGLLAVVFASEGRAQEAASLSLPIARATVITRPGSYFVLKNLDLPRSGVVIDIRASDVTVDLNGHTLEGPGGRGVGVSIGEVSNVRVHNGAISGLGIGVRVTDANAVKLDNLRIVGRDLGGTPPNIEIGVLIVNSRGVVVKHNLVSRTFLGIFVRGGGSGANRIVDNTLSGDQRGMLGICYNPSPIAGAVDGPSGDLVYNNLISRWNTGIQMSAQSVGNIIRENDIAYFTHAIQEVTPGSNVIEGNTRSQINP